MKQNKWIVAAAIGAMCPAGWVAAQTPQTAEPAPSGTVLYQSHGDSPEPDADRAAMTADVAPPGNAVSDRERSAVRITAYDIDTHMTLATGEIATRARITLRNDGADMMTRVPLQISSSLHWDTAAQVDGAERRPIAVTEQFLDTDADHTGKAREGVFVLPRPLPSGASVTLDLFYTGALGASSDRLKRIGAEATQADAADWDAVGAGAVALRGFGDVLWYPVASPALFLGDGAKLFDAIGAAKLRGQDTHVRLRLTLNFAGQAPVAVYFCGRRQALTAVSDEATPALVGGSGIATAEFADSILGFRTLSLFLVKNEETRSGIADPDDPMPLLAVETTDDAVLPRLNDAAVQVGALQADFMGPKPLTALTLLDHPGQAFEDGPLLVAPVESLATSDAQQALAHSLTHAWVQTGQPWMDEGLAQFFALEWTERERGREAAIAEMRAMLDPLALAEPAFADKAEADAGTPGEPLIAARDEVFYRRKAAAVWWMLHDLAGDEAFRATLAAWRVEPLSHAPADEQARSFEKLLEAQSHKDLDWFFTDWVLHDKGLPDLSIVDVTPRLLPAGKGHDSGWLVAVTVHNDGAATAEVPLVVRSGSFSTTRQLRVPGFATVTERVLTEGEPAEVLLNDGTVPELKSSTHSRQLTIYQQPN